MKNAWKLRWILFLSHGQENDFPSTWIVYWKMSWFVHNFLQNKHMHHPRIPSGDSACYVASGITPGYLRMQMHGLWKKTFKIVSLGLAYCNLYGVPQWDWHVTFNSTNRIRPRSDLRIPMAMEKVFLTVNTLFYRRCEVMELLLGNA